LDSARLDERPDPFPDAPASSERSFAPAPYWADRPKFQDRRWRHIVLLVLTILSTTYVGAFHNLSFQADNAIVTKNVLDWLF
jgi:hypothetical protein